MKVKPQRRATDRRAILLREARLAALPIVSGMIVPLAPEVLTATAREFDLMARSIVGGYRANRCIGTSASALYLHVHFFP